MNCAAALLYPPFKDVSNPEKLFLDLYKSANMRLDIEAIRGKGPLGTLSTHPRCGIDVAI